MNREILNSTFITTRQCTGEVRSYTIDTLIQMCQRDMNARRTPNNIPNRRR